MLTLGLRLLAFNRQLEVRVTVENVNQRMLVLTFIMCYHWLIALVNIK